jgi:chromosome partitioning protein
MTAKVISLVQQKGGAGRSTLCCNIAGVLSKTRPTALIDCDSPQGTATGWHYIREQAGLADGLTLATAEDHKELVEKERRLKADHDFIVIDSPPRNAAMTRAAVILADLNIIPLAPTALEIWSTNDVVEVIGEAAGVRKDIDARLCWNRYRAFTKSAGELSTAVKKELPLPLLTP